VVRTGRRLLLGFDRRAGPPHTNTTLGAEREGMDIRTTSPWIVESNGVDDMVATMDDVSRQLSVAEQSAEGSLSICADLGPRPLWQRILGAKRNVISYFMLEWADGYASLIFHDEKWSEFRAIDKEHPVAPSESTRLKMAHGELRPHPIEECMEKKRAFDAVRHLLQTGERPSWLSYRYVG